MRELIKQFEGRVVEVTMMSGRRLSGTLRIASGSMHLAIEEAGGSACHFVLAEHVEVLSILD